MVENCVVSAEDAAEQCDQPHDDKDDLSEKGECDTEAVWRNGIDPCQSTVGTQTGRGPCPPVSDKRPIRSECTSLQAMGTESNSGCEVQEVDHASTDLHQERANAHPFASSKRYSNWNVGYEGECEQNQSKQRWILKDRYRLVPCLPARP